MFCIVLAHRPHCSFNRSAWKHTFLKPGLRVEKSENAIAPPLDLWTLRHSISTTTTTTADYCLCSCFLLLTRLVVECESQQQFDLIIDPHKWFWFPCTCHYCLHLVVFGFSICLYAAQAFCACSVSSSPFLVNFKRHLEAWTMNYSVFSGSLWMSISLKGCRGRRRKKRLFWYVWTWPQALVQSCLGGTHICLVKRQLRTSSWSYCDSTRPSEDLQMFNAATIIGHLWFLNNLPIIFAIYRWKNIVKVSNVICPGVLVLSHY